MFFTLLWLETDSCQIFKREFETEHKVVRLQNITSNATDKKETCKMEGAELVLTLIEAAYIILSS